MKSTSEYIKLLRQFKEQNADKYGITKLGLFGSVARGEQDEDSDVDIYLESEPHSLFTMAHIKEELQEKTALLGFLCDSQIAKAVRVRTPIKITEVRC